MNRIVIRFTITILILISNICVLNICAQEKNVIVNIPKYKVTMNDIVVDNNYSKYPLIVYKEITYFPMTYSDCRFLGIETLWNGSKKELSIEKTGVSSAYNPYRINTKNKESYSATVPLNDDGTAIELNSSRTVIKTFGDKTFEY